ncbi:MAG: DUF624 domain-containing protein [Chloroflexi bacterium]|nr:DUF624 domain-containing protein [Chloroflexota bacterium]
MQLAFSIFGRSLRLLYQNLWPLLWLSTLWVLASVLLVTLPPATAALYACVDELVAGRDVPTRAFFAALRRYFVRGWLLFAINTLWLGAAVYGTLFYLSQSGPIQIAIVVPIYVLLFGALLQPYLFPLLIVQSDKSVRLVYRNAIVLLLRQPLFTVTVSIMLAAWTFIVIALNGPVLVVAVAASAFLQCLALRTVLPLALPPGTQAEEGGGAQSSEDTDRDEQAQPNWPE